MVKKKNDFSWGGQNMVKKWSKNDPKMAKNGPKMAKKVTGVPQKIQKNPKKIEKMAKNGPAEPRAIAPKRVKMH